ncbi:MAG: LysM peptidoglycan-binding domain-containing protein, partial [Planctomycetota bacterium]
EIAQHYYGTVRFTGELAEFNGIDNPDDLRAGHRLRLPAPTDLGAAAPAVTVPATEAPAPEPAPATYRIKPGDSLSGIARRFLRSTDRWHELYELNRDVIADPDNIRAGTVIRVPAATNR